jgi:hypothetical protein
MRLSRAFVEGHHTFVEDNPPADLGVFSNDSFVFNSIALNRSAFGRFFP